MFGLQVAPLPPPPLKAHVGASTLNVQPVVLDVFKVTSGVALPVLNCVDCCVDCCESVSLTLTRLANAFGPMLTVLPNVSLAVTLNVKAVPAVADEGRL